eukprot:6213297-Pleurochrysis_carterae.AAC.2
MIGALRCALSAACCGSRVSNTLVSGSFPIEYALSTSLPTMCAAQLSQALGWSKCLNGESALRAVHSCFEFALEKL